MSRVWISRVYDATRRPLGPPRIAVKVFGNSVATYYLSMSEAAQLVERLNRGIWALNLVKNKEHKR